MNGWKLIVISYHKKRDKRGTKSAKIHRILKRAGDGGAPCAPARTGGGRRDLSALSFLRPKVRIHTDLRVVSKNIPLSLLAYLK